MTHYSHLYIFMNFCIIKNSMYVYHGNSEPFRQTFPSSFPNQNSFPWHTVLFLSSARYYVLLIEKSVLFEKYNVLYKCRAMSSLS